MFGRMVGRATLWLSSQYHNFNLRTMLSFLHRDPWGFFHNHKLIWDILIFLAIVGYTVVIMVIAIHFTHCEDCPK